MYKDLQLVVCKGNAEGFNIYVCPTCKSIYCKKCVQAVIDLENECWSCSSPLDKSKPVKAYEPEIKIENNKDDKKNKS